MDTLSDTGPYTYPAVSAGYRLQPPGSGWVFSARVGTTGVSLRLGYGISLQP